MATYIEMPKLSDTMTEGTLVRWRKQIGEYVKVGDVIADVETDKATMEMESFDDGVLHRIYIQEGGKVPIGAKMALLLTEGEEAPADADAPPPSAVHAGPAKQSAAVGPAASTANSARAPGAPSPGRLHYDENPKASPLARKMAADRGIPLNYVVGTGPGGRVTRRDIENFVPPAPQQQAMRAGGLAAPAIKPVVGPDDSVVELSSMRSIIADRLVASKQQIPHFYLRMEIDAQPMVALRKTLNESAGEGGSKYTFNDFILLAAVQALQAFPSVNSAWNGSSIVRFKSIGLAVAVAVDEGLTTPVVKQAEGKSLLEISQAVKDLAGRARDKKLKPSDFDGGTITVSNLGAFGVDHFDAIINPPQAAILSIGAIAKKPVVNASGELAVGTRMWLGLSCDHRVIDGAVGAQFLAKIKELLESPAAMVI